ncbi:MAG: LPS-assembly lipoprotein LptM domain-containing protein [Xanthobacteraceae bacterium]
MNVSSRFCRIALIGVAAAALLLAGCGRKGMLEAPPSANALAAPPAPAPSGPALGEPDHSQLEGERRDEQPTGAPAKKSFFLDFLLK